MDEHNRESIIYIRSEDILKGFVVLVLVLFIVFLCFSFTQYGKRSAWKEISDYCRTSDLFTIPENQGLFSCYRADIEG